MKFAVDPVWIRRAPFEQRVSGNSDTDPKRAQMRFAMQFHAAADLEGRPLHGLNRGDESVDAYAQGTESPRVLVADPSASEQSIITDDEVGVRLKQIENPLTHALIVRRFAKREIPAIGTGMKRGRALNFQNDRDFIMRADCEIERLRVAIESGKSFKVRALIAGGANTLA